MILGVLQLGGAGWTGCVMNVMPPTPGQGGASRLEVELAGYIGLKWLG